MKLTNAERFVDASAVVRLFGDNGAATLGITREVVQEMLVDVSPPEMMQRGPYSKFIMFPDKSLAAQVRGSKRWEVDR